MYARRTCTLTLNTHTYSHMYVCAQPFVQYHLEKTTIRNQKARRDEGKLFACVLISLSISSCAAVKASLDVQVLDVSPPFWSIFKQIWVHAVSVFLVLGVTLSLFPSVISIIESTVPNPKASHWTGEQRSHLMEKKAFFVQLE